MKLPAAKFEQWCAEDIIHLDKSEACSGSLPRLEELTGLSPCWTNKYFEGFEAISYWGSERKDRDKKGERHFPESGCKPRDIASIRIDYIE